MSNCLPRSQFVHNVELGHMGRIIVAWRSDVCRVVESSKMDQHMCLEVFLVGGSAFFLSAVYGSNDYIRRRALWRSLVENKKDGVPWFIVGDFNVIRCAEQMVGGSLPQGNIMGEFNECIEEVDVTEEHPSYRGIVDETWGREVGFEFDVPYGRISHVKQELVVLNKQHYANLSMKMKGRADMLQKVQEEVFSGDVAQDNMARERNVRAELDRVEEVIVDFYRRLFTSQGSLTVEQIHTIKRVVDKKIPKKAVEILTFKPTFEEVRPSVFEMVVGKSPSSDGFGIKFYKFNWNVVAQSVFLPRRSLVDSVLMIQELVQGYNLETRLPRAAINVDIQKAYDMVKWGALEAVMEAMSFLKWFIYLIMQCLSTVRFSVNVNGTLDGWFRSTRGLR
ncbi:hypothetical protein LIER_41640 [Lithospermum erythrorhizon]|uniref:Reverse transcriptase domain-containing protein n=1 Tax=Lithospermum erythrorhizon TaxID=34254 RepID=A0AAV3RDF7_LITER